MNLVLIGIQGSGKGTQARKLEENYGFKIYETGTFLREIAQSETPLGKIVKETINAGKQVTPYIVENILQEVVNNNIGKNLILDGFVRNRGNKDSMDKIVSDYKVLYLKLEENIARNRLLGRMYDKETGETFVNGTTVNPKNGNILIKRADDEEEAINTRIKLFFEITMPIVEEYKKEGRLIQIDANQSIDEVTKEILNKLGL